MGTIGLPLYDFSNLARNYISMPERGMSSPNHSYWLIKDYIYIVSKALGFNAFAILMVFTLSVVDNPESPYQNH